MTLDDVVSAVNQNSELLIFAALTVVYCLGFIAGQQR